MRIFLRSFKHAFKGILKAIRDERNLKVQFLIAVVVIYSGFYFQLSDTEWVIILLCMALVIGLELINSAIESLVDLISQERNPLAGKAKDIAAGAVLFVSIVSLIVGILIFRKYIV
jgi:diacylglycerol kinase